MAGISNEFVSLYYIDSISGKNIQIPIRPWIVGSDNTAYADSIPTSSFGSKYLFSDCKIGIRNFKLKFYRPGVTELHDLFIDFKFLPPPGGFQIPDATIDGKALINSPVDTGKYGQVATVFIYNR
jgi:hypothetical protein